MASSNESFREQVGDMSDVDIELAFMTSPDNFIGKGIALAAEQDPDFLAEDDEPMLFGEDAAKIIFGDIKE